MNKLKNKLNIDMKHKLKDHLKREKIDMKNLDVEKREQEA